MIFAIICAWRSCIQALKDKHIHSGVKQRPLMGSQSCTLEKITGVVTIQKWEPLRSSRHSHRDTRLWQQVSLR